MAITIDVNYSNSFYLKRIYGTGSNTPTSLGPGYPTNAEIPLGYEQGRRNTSWETPIVANTTYDWCIEESIGS